MADERMSVETVPLWRMKPQGCVNSWGGRSQQLLDPLDIRSYLQGARCEYKLLPSGSRQAKPLPVWRDVFRFGIAEIFGLSRFMPMLAQIPEGSRDEKIDFEVPTAARTDSHPYLDLQIRAGAGLFRVMPPPLENRGFFRLQDQNLGGFPAQLPSVTLEY
ncbi:MAG: hypothetical protein WC956_02065 [bacterium]